MLGKILSRKGRAMDEARENRRSTGEAGGVATVLLLFVGFCGAIGLLVTAILGIPVSFAFVFLAAAVIGLAWGLSRLGKQERRVRPVVMSLVAAVVLLPLYVPIGIGVGFLVPVLPGYVRTFVSGPDVIQSVVSPDGNFEAYVVERPSIDPPNQALYIQRRDNIHFVSIAKLAEDIDSIIKIHWSPESDTVVFHTRCHLFAVRVPGYERVAIPLGGEWIRTKPSKRSTFSGAGPRVAVADIQFPQPGSFSYRLEGVDTFKTIAMGSF
jgi:hypothetical protein